MKRLLTVKPVWLIVWYVLADAFCVGAGMGVPFFCILLGLPVGWVVARRIAAGFVYGRANGPLMRNWLRQVLRYALLSSCVTFLGMLAIWGPQARLLFDAGADYAQQGMPLILYEPKASFVGFLVLMVFISPFLQFLMTLLGAHLAMLTYSWNA